MGLSCGSAVLLCKQIVMGFDYPQVHQSMTAVHFGMACWAEDNQIFRSVVSSVFIAMMDFENVIVCAISASEALPAMRLKRQFAIVDVISIPIMGWLDFFHSANALCSVLALARTESQSALRFTEVSFVPFEGVAAESAGYFNLSPSARLALVFPTAHAATKYALIAGQIFGFS